MAYQVEVVAVAATGTLIWQTSTGQSPDPALSSSGLIFPAGTASDPRHIIIAVPTGSTLVPVTAVGGTPISGATGFVGPTTVTFDVFGNDSFVGAISGTGNVTVMVGGM